MAICLFLNLTLPSSATAQVIKLKATGISFKEKKNGSWQDWSEWEDANILVTLDLDVERIIVYSSTKQTFDIAKYEGESKDKDGDSTFSFLCVNQEGYECLIKFLKMQDGSKQLYFNFNKTIVAYNVYTLD